MANRTPSSPSCGCGCGKPVAPGRRYVQGHDAKHKSALLNAATGDDKREATRARAEIARLGWGHHLAIREAMIAKRNAPKAKPTAAKATGPRKLTRNQPAAKPLPPGELAAGTDGRVPASVGTLRSEASPA